MWKTNEYFLSFTQRGKKPMKGDQACPFHFHSLLTSLKITLPIPTSIADNCTLFQKNIWNQQEQLENNSLKNNTTALEYMKPLKINLIKDVYDHHRENYKTSLGDLTENLNK